MATCFIEMSNKIYYFFDPICGWCYGVSKHFAEFWKEHREDYTFEVITGGMVRPENARPIGEMADYLGDAYKRVEEMSGAKFGVAFLKRVKEGSTVYSSDTPSKVFHAIATALPQRKPEIASAIQSLIYDDGIDTEDLDGYGPIAQEFELDIPTLKRAMESEQVADAYQADLYTTQQFGVRGFPFSVVELDGEFYLLAKGFRPKDELNSILAKAIEYHGDRK